MINKLIGLVARLTVGKQLVAGMGKAHNLLDGRKSEISLAIYAVVYLLKLVGVLPAEAVAPIQAALEPIIGLALMARASKVINIVDKVVPELPKPEEPKAQ